MRAGHPRPSDPAMRGVLLILLSVGLLVGTPARSSGAESAGGTDQIQAYVDAGEFAPAVALAQASATSGERDRLLGQVAAAQAGFGQRQASLRTASSIQSDVTRSQAIRDIASQPIGQNDGLGGNSLADFDSLIELITTTVAPDSWDEVGGPGSIDSFENGVYVDAHGVMRDVLQDDLTGRLELLKQSSRPGRRSGSARQSSRLRKVSLNRLEKQVQLHLAMGLPLDDEMTVLAGLQRVSHVFVYPDSGDLVLAGPAGGWSDDGRGRILATDTGRPVLLLDDLVGCLRQIRTDNGGRFGCSIDPRQEGLTRAKAYLDGSQKRSIPRGRRSAWLEEVRSRLGEQDIRVFGIEPDSRLARVLVAADYHMKLVGIGLADATVGVQSYLDMIEVPRGQQPPPIDVLRWWFTLDYDAVAASPGREAFEIRGQGVRVLGENEMLSKTGQRVHTGRANALNAEFASAFTQHFDALADKYPVYADLQNVFNLALVAALLDAENLPERIDWHLTCFGDPAAFPEPQGRIPRTVESVMNHRVINRRHIVAAVSGGVRAEPFRYVRRDRQLVEAGRLSSDRSLSSPPKLDADAWWWD